MERCAAPESKILTGSRQALAFARGEMTDDVVVHPGRYVEVKALRPKLGMSQAKLAARHNAQLTSDAGPARPKALFVTDHGPGSSARYDEAGIVGS